MGGSRLSRSLWTGVLAGVLVLGGCNTRPTSDVFAPETTTTTTLGGSATESTTTQTLPAVEERVTATIVSIADGDTVSAHIGGVASEIRLLGINAPEHDECWGEQATAYLSSLIGSATVVVVAGEQDVDTFGRLLRYLYVETEGEPLFVNASMVSTGNAVGLSHGHALAAGFKTLESSAYQSGAGMWGTFVCGDTEGTSADRPVIRVASVEADPQGPDEEHLDDERVTIVNEGYGRVSLSGWRLRDESSRHRFTFPDNTVIAPGESVTVATGCGDGTDAIRWCNDGPVWSNQGDTVIVSDTLGNVVVHHAYTSDEAR